ncbi:hypothetical protein [Salibacterium sp. K-3]
MDLTIFMTGTGLFGAGFFMLLLFLWRKKQLILPFLLMGAGVLLCFAGLIMSSPLTETDDASATRTETTSQATSVPELPVQPSSEKR